MCVLKVEFAMSLALPILHLQPFVPQAMFAVKEPVKESS